MKGDMNLIKLFIQGGWVMWVILLLSVVSLTITLERIIVVYLQRFKLTPGKFIDEFAACLKKNNGDKMATADQMIAYCQNKKRLGLCAEVFTAGLQKYKDPVARAMNPSELKLWMKTGVEERANIELPALEAHLGALAVISNVSTLCGLFGTVIGMIESFTSMANSPGGVKADEMAGGIAVALVCTAGGLCVAVPSLILYNLLKGFIEGFVLQIEDASVEMIDTLVS
ncbi:MAG: MotA/TolQ/ExbB proton channel family protein [Chitinivibrionales bacterium]|nr:MotA/TolQ/ExbB proton channel family protein [Chitinivibrionales bacterium]